MKTIFFITLFILNCFAKNFTVATYNVENLFDLNNDKTEYQEYVPNQTNWNKNNVEIKLNNLAKVINAMNPDIIALQEVESKEALKLLNQKLPQYHYCDFIKNPKSAIGLGVLSQYPIINSQAIKIKSNSTVARPIQKITLNIENHLFTLFNNHWSSKKAPESKRIEYALSLKEFLDTLDSHEDYILVGDFNSNYDEYLTFKNDKKLNDTYHITGINQILNTTLNLQFVQKETLLNHKEAVHYNLWLELPYTQRFSYKFKNQNETPDNIILSKALFDDKNIAYVNDSLSVYKAPYLFDGKRVNRWEVKNSMHQGKGFSDHLPLMATFTTNAYTLNVQVQPQEKISFLYTLNQLNSPLKIEDVTVIYKEGNSAILKQKNNRAIYAYGCAQKLQEGMSYDIEVQEISNYFGLQEIKKLNILTHKTQQKIQPFYLNAHAIDLFDIKYQNEIITGLSGVFENGYLKFKHQKIRVYAKDKTLLPKNGQKITIMSAHLGFYKSNVQIILHKKSDIRVN